MTKNYTYHGNGGKNVVCIWKSKPRTVVAKKLK
ncbi:uncharacterized protein METZ01_LOCUS333083 [marine metagenome]|uniref:Uncharacterized protein n=1 Tax=marine metagenome TaxID=408172 RepID=A0A382Q3V5_9ZZZZ